MEFAELAHAVKRSLPEADIRTDQADVIRVYLNDLLGGLMKLPSGQYKLVVVDPEIRSESGQDEIVVVIDSAKNAVFKLLELLNDQEARRSEFDQMNVD